MYHLYFFFVSKIFLIGFFSHIDLYSNIFKEIFKNYKYLLKQGMFQKLEAKPITLSWLFSRILGRKQSTVWYNPVITCPKMSPYWTFSSFPITQEIYVLNSCTLYTICTLQVRHMSWAEQQLVFNCWDARMSWKYMWISKLHFSTLQSIHCVINIWFKH